MADVIKDRLYYDAHARNVIVDCKDGKDLESLIRDGEIGGGTPDMTNSVRILYLSTVPDLDTLADPSYNYVYLGDLQLYVDKLPIDFYAYIRNAAINDNIPIGTVIVNESDDLRVISEIGGTWELLGKMGFAINGEKQIFYAFKKTGSENMTFPE